MTDTVKRKFKISSIPYGVRTLAVLVALTLALGFMVADRLNILTSGTEVVLKTRPVDPRDFFRGHYARLYFDISEVAKPASQTDVKFARNDPVFVRLKRAESGFWEPVSVYKRFPPQQPDTVVIKGTIKNTYSKKLSILYGMERYFAPKKEALKLEDLGRDQTEVAVIARISKSGEPAISGLMIDGKKIYEEPLF